MLQGCLMAACRSRGRPTSEIRDHSVIWAGRTRKLPRILLGLQTRPSVQRLIPLSCSSKTNTAPLWTIPRSRSINRRVTRGIMPRLAASKTSRASKVVSMYPRNGGSRTGGGVWAAMTVCEGWMETCMMGRRRGRQGGGGGGLCFGRGNQSIGGCRMCMRVR